MQKCGFRKTIGWCMAVICLFCLSGCTTTYKNSPYVGTWVSTTIKSENTTFSTNDLIGEYRMVLQENGDAVVSCSGEEETDTWKPTDQGVKLRLINGTEYTMFLEDSRLILEIQNVKFTFEKRQQTQ